MMTIISITIIILGLFSSFYLFYKKPFITRKSSSDKKITIIIPVRNEESSIGNLLNDLKKQSTHHIEVIVVDDGSTDKTKEIVNQYDVRYFYISDNQKPKDYLGKSYAIEYGSNFATHDLLLFLDADVRLNENAITSLIYTHEKDADTVISLQPYHHAINNYEQLSLPFNLISLAANQTTTPHKQSIGLFGPCILISKENYLKINKHYHVRDSIIEDVSLGKVLKKHRISFKCYLGYPLISYRMYPDGVKTLYQGWTKNIIYGALNTPFMLSIYIFFFVASILAIPLELTKSILQKNMIFLIIYFCFYIIWMIRLFILVKPVGNFKKISIIFFPIVFINFFLIFLLSTFKKLFNLPVTWKDRKIKVGK